MYVCVCVVYMCMWKEVYGGLVLISQEVSDAMEKYFTFRNKVQRVQM